MEQLQRVYPFFYLHKGDVEIEGLFDDPVQGFFWNILPKEEVGCLFGDFR